MSLEEVQLELEIDPQEPLYNKKSSSCMYMVLQYFNLKSDLSNQVVTELISYARFISITSKEAKYISHKNKKGYQPMISIQNEVLAWKKIHQIANLALARYPTSLKDDKALLAKEDRLENDKRTLTYNTRNCVLLRVGEKKILHYLVETATNLIELSKMNRKGAIGAMMKKFNIFKPSMSYVKGTFIPLIPETAAHDEL